MFLRVLLLLLTSALLMPVAHADPATTRDALDRLEEILEVQVADGRLDPEQVMPAILVSTQPRYEASQAWFTVRSIEALQSAFGNEGLRLCEACMVPRSYVGAGAMHLQSGPTSLDEVIRLDDNTRGSSPAAQTGIWIEELASGVAIRIVDLHTGRVVFAMNVDPYLVENERSRRNYTLSEELDRRARGDSLTHVFVDAAIWPGQHLGIDFADQWGPSNNNLSGVSLTMLDPTFGIGGSYYRVLPLGNIMVGGKAILSLPTAIVRSIDPSDQPIDVIDPLLSVVGVVRVPFGRSNYGAVMTLSTNGAFGIGISLLNPRFIPVSL